MVTENFTDFTKNFSCNYCDINCSRKSEWDRHVMTRKHNSNSTGNKVDVIKNSETKILVCDKCNKIYKSRKGLWGHNKICPRVCGPRVCGPRVCRTNIISTQYNTC